MKLTYYGHSCFSVTAGGKNILFDPFITGNELAKAINIDEINPDYIFVSHAHYDHMLDVTAIAERTGAMVLGCWEIHDHFQKQGLTNTRPINPGGQLQLEFGAVKSFSAQHSSSFPDGSYGGVPAGFALKTKDGNFYYSGDTALALDMTLVPKWAQMDFAVFPVGDLLTMGVDDAIEAAQFVKTTRVMGVHYDTFGLIKIDHAAAIEKFKKAGLSLQLPAIGASIDI